MLNWTFNKSVYSNKYRFDSANFGALKCQTPHIITVGKHIGRSCKNEISIILILIAISFNLSLNGQNRIISGRVISEDLEPLPMLDINNSDTVLLGKTDLDGYFKISIPLEIDRLLLSYVGMEWTEIKLRKDCDSIEVVIMYDAIYDFITLKKADRTS
jgi:hypothetical protein